MKKIASAFAFLFFVTKISNAQNIQIPKIAYEYHIVEKDCLLQFFPGESSIPASRVPPTDCYAGVPDFTQVGKDGWELVSAFRGYFQRQDSHHGTGVRGVSVYSRLTFIFKRAKPINEQQFYGQLNSIAQSKIDSSMNEVKKFLISTLNQSTKELFSTEYADAMKENILAKIRSEMKSICETVINETKRQ